MSETYVKKIYLMMSPSSIQRRQSAANPRKDIELFLETICKEENAFSKDAGVIDKIN